MAVCEAVLVLLPAVLVALVRGRKVLRTSDKRRYEEFAHR
jgi:hypothetical protein